MNEVRRVSVRRLLSYASFTRLAAAINKLVSIELSLAGTVGNNLLCQPDSCTD